MSLNDVYLVGFDTYPPGKKMVRTGFTWSRARAERKAAKLNRKDPDRVDKWHVVPCGLFFVPPKDES